MICQRLLSQIILATALYSDGCTIGTGSRRLAFGPAFPQRITQYGVWAWEHNRENCWRTVCAQRRFARFSGTGFQRSSMTKAAAPIQIV